MHWKKYWKTNLVKTFVRKNPRPLKTIEKKENHSTRVRNLNISNFWNCAGKFLVMCIGRSAVDRCSGNRYVREHVESRRIRTWLARVCRSERGRAPPAPPAPTRRLINKLQISRMCNIREELELFNRLFNKYFSRILLIEITKLKYFFESLLLPCYKRSKNVEAL